MSGRLDAPGFVFVMVFSLYGAKIGFLVKDQTGALGAIPGR